MGRTKERKILGWAQGLGASPIWHAIREDGRAACGRVSYVGDPKSTTAAALKSRDLRVCDRIGCSNAARAEFIAGVLGPAEGWARGVDGAWHAFAGGRSACGARSLERARAWGAVPGDAALCEHAACLGVARAAILASRPAPAAAPAAAPAPAAGAGGLGPNPTPGKASACSACGEVSILCTCNGRGS